jgi:uracil-DNA glycosylase
MNPRQQLAEHLRYLATLGVDGLGNDPAWSRPLTPVEGPVLRPVRSGAAAGIALAAIREEIGDCTRCKLHRLGRSQVVFGVGNPEADLMFVGEAPGHDERHQVPAA